MAKRCTAKAKRTGEQCKAYAIQGKDKCRVHGGLTPVKHGLYSKYTKHKLADKVNQLANDPELLDLRQQIAFKQALILDNLQYLQKQLEPKDLDVLAGLSDKVSKDIERLNKIEHGQKYVLQVEEVQAVINQIVLIIQQEVADTDTVHRLSGRLQEVSW